MNESVPTAKINKWLLPLSWIYGFFVFWRNKMFDWKIFKRVEYDIPIICIGNITVGGTGKTPHIELLIRILKEQYRVAVLSRGYGRKTSGFQLATPDSDSLTIGDEPFQIYCKFPDITVTVDANRRRGIEKLLAHDTPPEIILLDDAFQHRYVDPSYKIVLSDYNRPVYEDTLLPAGRLRESMSHLFEASMVVVTKCPDSLNPIDYRIISHDMDILACQELFFTKLEYKNLLPVFSSEHKESVSLDFLQDKCILLVTGIASPTMIIEKLSEYTDKVQVMSYPDHHRFKAKDIKKIKATFERMEGENKIIVVTEKDAARLITRNDIDEDMKTYFYSLPIQVSFMDTEKEELFKSKIYKHVREDKRNRRFYKK